MQNGIYKHLHLVKGITYISRIYIFRTGKKTIPNPISQPALSLVPDMQRGYSLRCRGTECQPGNLMRLYCSNNTADIQRFTTSVDQRPVGLLPAANNAYPECDRWGAVGSVLRGGESSHCVLCRRMHVGVCMLVCICWCMYVGVRMLVFVCMLVCVCWCVYVMCWCLLVYISYVYAHAGVYV